ncbi:Uncharacterised protein [uncultured archaeon]|nr:Uncharacterised protein [uncultured archaeon]
MKRGQTKMLEYAVVLILVVLMFITIGYIFYKKVLP